MLSIYCNYKGSTVMINSVCIFGDSVSKGVVFDSVLKKYTLLKDSFVSIIQNQDKISINNYSRFGCTITKGGEVLKRHKSELSKFDYTVLEFGGNDCDFNWKEVSASPDSKHKPKTPLTVFQEKYEKTIDFVKSCGGNPVLLSLPPVDAKRYFNWISRGLNPDNILSWLGDVEYIYRFHEMYNLAVNKIAKLKDIPLIDISSEFLQADKYQELLCEDGIHPNKKGHELIGKTIEQYALSNV